MSTHGRRRWLLPVLMVIFVAVPLAEVWLLLRVGDWLGLWPTIGLLVADAVVGAWLSKREGTRAWTALKGAMGTGRMPQGELADAALVLSGGIMLMFPGFFTDIVGLFFLVPFTRPLARRLLGWVLKTQLDKVQARATPFGQLGATTSAPRAERPSARRSSPPSQGGPTIIDGEVVDGPGD